MGATEVEWIKSTPKKYKADGSRVFNTDVGVRVRCLKYVSKKSNQRILLRLHARTMSDSIQSAMAALQMQFPLISCSVVANILKAIDRTRHEC